MHLLRHRSDPHVVSDRLFESSLGSTRRYHIYIYMSIDTYGYIGLWNVGNGQVRTDGSSYDGEFVAGKALLLSLSTLPLLLSMICIHICMHGTKCVRGDFGDLVWKVSLN